MLKSDIHISKTDCTEKSERLEGKIIRLQNNESKSNHVEATSLEMKNKPFAKKLNGL